MTDDIVARLRNRTDPDSLILTSPSRHAPDRLCYQAADEIERLRAERDALRELLKTYGKEVAGLRARIDAALNKGGGDE